MNKKLVSVITTAGAFVLGFVMFMISKGHVDKALKMHDRLASGFSEMYALLLELKDAGVQGGKPQMLTFARENKSRAAEAANKMREVCDYYEKVRVPSALKSKLSAVRTSIPEMRRFIDSFEGVFKGVMLESELKDAVATLARETQLLAETGGFIKAESSFISEMKRLRSRRRFIWL